VIDKLDLRIPTEAVTGGILTNAFSHDPAKREKSCVQYAHHYFARFDLRQRGIDALLHFKCKHGDHHSKLEILDVGKKGYSEILEIIREFTQADPEELGIMRIDLAADVPNVTVPWFKSHLRFKYKRSEREFGQNPYGQVSHGEIETIIAGSRPNVFRIYNKVAENLVQLRRMQRTVSKEADLLDFENEFGMKKTDVLTRLERQCGGKGVPAEVPTLDSLRNLLDFNPFSRVELVKNSTQELPRPEQCKGMEYYTGLGLHLEAQRIGMQGLRKQLNKQSNGNAARTLTSYGQFFPEGKAPITMERILKIFHESTRKQLAA
jgi:hypothetical protein